jgi:acyl carrier protein
MTSIGLQFIPLATGFDPSNFLFLGSQTFRDIPRRVFLSEKLGWIAATAMMNPLAVLPYFENEVFTLTSTLGPISNQLIARVAQVIARTQHIPAESVTLDKTFEELKIDSLDGINVIFEVENEFHVEIPDAAVYAIRSVRDMVEGLETLLAAQASGLAAEPGSITGGDSQ